MADKLTLDRHAMKDRSTAHLRVYVGGLTESATEELLYDHFIPHGQINGIVINRNFGFIQFENESSVQAAISKANGSVFQGKSLNVRPANANKPPMNRETEVVVVQSDVPPAVALSDSMGIEEGTEPYDSYGNYIGDSHKDTRNSGKDNLFVSEEREEPYDSYGNYNDQDKHNSGYGDDDYGAEDSYNGGWNDMPARGRGRGGPRGGPRGRGRGRPGAGERGFRDRSPVALPSRQVNSDWVERDGFNRYQHQQEYPRALPVMEKNDCEIIVVSKALTEYAEYIEGRLKHLGIVVDLLFPMEDVPIGKVLGNIASRGCLYAILVMPQNQDNRSLTLTILHGLPQEHRNMPLEDALQLMSRNFQEVQRGGPSGREAVYALLGQLADGRALTVLQYDKVIEYLQERREQQVKLELGEPLPSSGSNKTAVDLQQRILSILNDKKVLAPSVSPPMVVTSQKKQLIDDPTVRKALDSILQKYI